MGLLELEPTTVQTPEEEAVARGAALLDGRVPGWAADLAGVPLDMSQCTECVVGHLYDVDGYVGIPYEVALAELGVARRGWEGDVVGDEVWYGFNIADADYPDEEAEDAAWARLERAWYTAIAARTDG